MSGLCRILMVSFALMSVLTWVVPVAAEHVSVRASRGDDFGRIVFLWDRPVSHEMAHNGRTLTIRFGRPIEACCLVEMNCDYLMEISRTAPYRSKVKGTR